jgi:hypothetical protein
MKAVRWLEHGAIYLVILGALVAGLAASYGREREANRLPGRQWWLNRLLILPLLAIAATAATDAFSLSKSMAAFTAAMLSLGGYDALRLIESRWRSRIEARAQLLSQLNEQAFSNQGISDSADPRSRPIEVLRESLPVLPSTVEQLHLLDRIQAKGGADAG